MFIARILTIVLLVGIDQISKLFISSSLSLGESINLSSFLDFTLLHNTGVAFSFFSSGGVITRWVLVLVVAFVLTYILLLIFNRNSHHYLETTSLLLIFSGGLGNLIDRVLLGHVIDFIHVYYKAYSFYVFNLADSFITLGITVYLIYFLFFQAATNHENNIS
tara:strand:+ start:1112 stop:1600 length:489 start_codon:yes stop_codon:yes gene_type:complete